MSPSAAASSMRLAPVVVAPTFNNVRTLLGVLDRVEAMGLPMIVVNDGSTDGTPEALAAWMREGRTVAVHRADHRRNRGKAAALRTGFDAASALGYTHAVTMDTDGQLDPQDIASLLSRSTSSPQALVVGVRADALEHCPRRSLIGRKLSNLAIRLESGCRVSDSQCGLRVYPLAEMKQIGCRAQRFAFESEVITRSAWAGCPIIEVPVTSRYLPRGERVSHFRPLVDSLRCVRLHARLLGRAILPLPHRQVVKTEAVATPRSIGQRLLAWIRPDEMWRQLRESDSGRVSVAAGVGIGAFIANMPIYGLQTLAALYAARQLHLHPLSVLLGSMLSTPPVGPVLIVAALIVGRLLLGGEWDPRMLEQWNSAELWTIGRTLLMQWIVGSVVVGAVCMAASFALVLALGRAPGRAPGPAPGPAPAPGKTRSRGSEAGAETATTTTPTNEITPPAADARETRCLN